MRGSKLSISATGLWWLLWLGMVAANPGSVILMAAALAVFLAWHLARPAVQSIWLAPRLAKAEAAWAERRAPSEVLACLGRRPYGTGELGYRMHLLAAQANLALGFRNEAWSRFFQAQIARLPFWKKAFVLPFFRSLPDPPGSGRFGYGRFLLRLAPRMPHLRHRMGILHLRRGREGDTDRAWEQFREVLPLASEDILLLEDLMLAALSRGDTEFADSALALLQQRHGDPRLAWNRSAPSASLLQRGRPAEALALLRTLPSSFRTEPWHWVGEARALRQLGDTAGAWASVDAGLAQFPGSFRLWMERQQLAMETQRFAEARHCLQEAKAALAQFEGEAAGPPAWEWNLRSAEFAFWVDGDARAAWDFLREVPDAGRGPQTPRLELELQIALEDFENALAACKALLSRSPGDPALLLLQGECLAGLEAWEALLAFLDSLGEPPRKQAGFWHLRGLALAHLGEVLPSRMDLERAALMEPEHLRLVLDAGHACADLGEWERSENHWRQALRLDQACEEALIHLAESRQALHDDEGARRYLRECLTHHPDCAEAHTRLAELESN